MITKYVCWMYGHKRGKMIAQDQTSKTYQCPRCLKTWTRKVRTKK